MVNRRAVELTATIRIKIAQPDIVAYEVDWRSDSGSMKNSSFFALRGDLKFWACFWGR